MLVARGHKCTSTKKWGKSGKKSHVNPSEVGTKRYHASAAEKKRLQDPGVKDGKTTGRKRQRLVGGELRGE